MAGAEVRATELVSILPLARDFKFLQTSTVPEELKIRRFTSTHSSGATFLPFEMMPFIIIYYYFFILLLMPSPEVQALFIISSKVEVNQAKKGGKPGQGFSLPGKKRKKEKKKRGSGW